MSQTSTTFDAVLKDHYEEILADQINNKVRLRQLVENRGNKDSTDGKQVIFAAVVQRSWAGGSPGNSDLPSPGNVNTAKFTVSYKRLVGRIQIERFVMQQSRTDMGAFAKAMSVEMETMINTLKVIHNRQLTGDGTGNLGSVTAADNTAKTITLNSTYNSGTGINAKLGGGARHIKVGMTLCATSGTTTTLRGTPPWTVSAVNYTTNVVTFSGSPDLSSVVSGDTVYMFVSTNTNSFAQNNEINGLGGIIDDGTYQATFQNLSRTTYPILQSPVLANSGTLRNLTIQLIQDGIDLCDQASGSCQVKYLWAHHGIRSALATLVQHAARYESMKDMGRGIKESLDEGDYDTTLTVNNLPVVVDRDMFYYTIFGVDPKVLRYWELAPVQWAEIDGRRWHLVNGQDEMQAWAVMFGNLGCTQPNKMFAIRDINETVNTGFTPS